jgi:hypothetical protein
MKATPMGSAIPALVEHDPKVDMADYKQPPSHSQAERLRAANSNEPDLKRVEPARKKP